MRNLPNQAGIQTAPSQLEKIIRIVSNSAPRTAQSKTGTNNNGKSDIIGNFADLIHIPGDAALRNAQPDSGHRLAK